MFPVRWLSTAISIKVDIVYSIYSRHHSIVSGFAERPFLVLHRDLYKGEGRQQVDASGARAREAAAGNPPWNLKSGHKISEHSGHSWPVGH